MSSGILTRGILCLTLAAGVTIGCGCGGEQAQKPKAAAKSKPKAKLIPGEAEFNRAKQAGKSGDWKRAAALFGEAAQLFSQHEDDSRDTNHQNMAHTATVNRGISLERGGDLKAAAAIYRKVLVADPNNPMAAATLARTLIVIKEQKAARKTVEAALEHNPENAPLLNMLAGILRQSSNYKGAADAARRVLLRDQKNVAAIKNLALAYADQGKLQLAETFFRNALKLDAKDVSIRVNLGLIASKHGEHQKAILEFEEALTLDPKNGVALANIGAISLAFRDYSRATDHYKRALSAGMLTCSTASALGYALEGAQKGKEAIHQLGKAFELCPKEYELLFAKGMICMEQLRDDKCALKNFEAYTATKKKVAKDHPVHRFIASLKEQQAMEQAGPEMLEEEPVDKTAAVGEEPTGEAPKNEGKQARPQSSVNEQDDADRRSSG